MLISRNRYRLLDAAGEEGGAGGGAPTGEEGGQEGGGAAEGGQEGGQQQQQQQQPSEGLAANVQDESLREWIEGKGWTDVEGLARSAYNLEKLKGAPAEELVRLPQDATEDQAREVLQRLGLPESADKYELPDPPEGLEVNEDFQGFAKDMFHKAGLTSRQAAAVTEEYNNYLAEQHQAQQEKLQAQFTEEHETLKREWGNGYDRQLRVAQQAAEQLGIEADQIDQLEQTMGFAGTMKLFSKIGRAFGEDGFVDPETGDRGFNNQMTPAEAKAAYGKFLSDDGNRAALMNKNHPGHTEAMKEKNRLFAIMHPDEA